MSPKTTMYSILNRRTKSVSWKPKKKTVEKDTKKQGSKSDNVLRLLSKKETAHTSPVEEKLRTGKRRKETAIGREKKREREKTSEDEMMFLRIFLCKHSS